MMSNVWDTVHFALKTLLLIKKVNNLKDFNYVIADEIVKSHLCGRHVIRKAIWRISKLEIWNQLSLPCVAVSVLLVLKKKWGKVSWIFQNSSIRHITNTFSMTCRPHWCQKLLTCSKRESFYFWKIILQKCNVLKIKVRLNSVGFAFWMNKIRWPKPKHEWNKSA